MRILLLADQAEPTLWEFLDKRKLEGVDLILSCGDLPASYLSFLTCFTHAPILYVHGNHDARYAQKPPEGCICIEDQIYVHEGVRILGLGGSMRYRKAPHMYTEREMHSRVKKLWFKHTGFQVFNELIDKYHPKALVHGHVHQSYTHAFKRIRQRGDTLSINAFGYYIWDVDFGAKE